MKSNDVMALRGDVVTFLGAITGFSAAHEAAAEARMELERRSVARERPMYR